MVSDTKPKEHQGAGCGTGLGTQVPSPSRLLLEETHRGERKADWKVCRDRLSRLNLGPRGNEARLKSMSFIISQELTILKVEIRYQTG